MNRRDRQTAILELVRERALSTQAEVASALKDTGFDVVQTTVSRDIADLGLVKVRAPSGRRLCAARKPDAPLRRSSGGCGERDHRDAAGPARHRDTPSGRERSRQAMDERRIPRSPDYRRHNTS